MYFDLGSEEVKYHVHAAIFLDLRPAGDLYLIPVTPLIYIKLYLESSKPTL